MSSISGGYISKSSWTTLRVRQIGTLIDRKMRKIIEAGCQRGRDSWGHISAKSRHGAACTMKKVIVGGMMKNHEENVVNPIIDALKYLKAYVERVGGISDFFEPQSKVKYLKITRRQQSL